MKPLGLTLLAIGFLVAAFFSVRLKDLPATADNRWSSVEWTCYIPAFVIGAIGVAMLRISATKKDTHTNKIESNLSDLHTSVGRIVQELTTLIDRQKQLSVYDVHHLIDENIALELATFVDARETMIHVHGLPAYAEIMTQFAAGERSINRAWSASADGYIDEVWKCLDRAQSLMTNAQNALQKATSTPQMQTPSS